MTPGEKSDSESIAALRDVFRRYHQSLEANPPKADNLSAMEESAVAGGYSRLHHAGHASAAQIVDLFTEEYGHVVSYRKQLAERVYELVKNYLSVVVGLVILTAVLNEVVKISDAVLIALLSGAGVGLIGLLGTVIAYYFSSARERSSIIEAIFERALRGQGSQLDDDPPPGE